MVTRRGGKLWHPRFMPASTDEQWLTVPELVDILGVSQSHVRRLIEDHHLAAKRVDGVVKVPASFLKDGSVLPELHGTITVLADYGFHGDELVDWFLTEEPSLADTPINALRSGRKAEVRRIAQALL